MAATLLSIPILNSCSSKQEVQPVENEVVNAADIKVVNGRLVFADQKAFDKTRTALEEIGKKATSTPDLIDWERAQNFVSLRAVASSESAKLEQLESSGTPTPEYNMMVSFGFPTFYASIINPVGEYQIGNKIYWFHEGFKYQADSPEELVLIKQNPAQAKLKYQAGLYKSHAEGGTTNRVTRGPDPYSDEKHVKYFYITGESGSYRRTMYSASVYNEDQGYGFVLGTYSHFIRTNLNLLIKYEYYSFGKRKWYPAEGQNFLWQANVNFTGNALYPGQPSFPQIYNSSVNQAGSYSNGLTTLNMAVATVTTSSSTGTGEVGWNFEITGTLNGYPANDQINNYYVNSTPLW